MERWVWEFHLCALVSVLHLSNYRQITSDLDILGFLSWRLIKIPFRVLSLFFCHFYDFILPFIGRGLDKFGRSKRWGLDAAELQEGMQSLGHLLMWRDRKQGQSSQEVPQVLVLIISWLISGVSSKGSLRGSFLRCPSSQPCSTG